MDRSLRAQSNEGLQLGPDARAHVAAALQKHQLLQHHRKGVVGPAVGGLEGVVENAKGFGGFVAAPKLVGGPFFLLGQHEARVRVEEGVDGGGQRRVVVQYAQQVREAAAQLSLEK